MSEPIGRRDKIQDYIFRDKELLDTALTHRSHGNNNNERLEFLGDAILGFVIAEHLYQKFPDAPEGVLTRLRASLVKRETLAALARSLDLGALIKFGQGEKKSGGWRRDSILANTLEAVIGAVYLDSGIDECAKFIFDLFQDLFVELKTNKTEKDPKTTLQEILQEKKLPLPVYEVIKEQGQPHRRIFTVRCYVAGMDKEIIAEGRSKRMAEQAAAKKALDLYDYSR